MMAPQVELDGPRAANRSATPILDFHHPWVQDVVQPLLSQGLSNRSFLQEAHGSITDAVQPVYTVDELQPVSVTLEKRRGSCSQRMACLEAVCRAGGIATRVRALWVSGRFWYPRFRFCQPFIPRQILLSWPQFYLEEQWVDFDEIYGATAELVEKNSQGFTNTNETLFEAVSLMPVDMLGKSRGCGAICGASVDLSRFIMSDAGFFDTRDSLYAELGSFQHCLRGRAFEMIFGGRKSR